MPADPLMATSSPRERRGAARVRVNAAVTGLFGRRRHRWWLREISASGALVLRGAAPRPASLHRLEIDAGRGEPLRVLARTVRSVGTFHAVRFVGLADVDRLELAEVIDGLQARETP